MTAQEFTAFYPQFANFTPAVVLNTYVSQANKRFGWFQEDDAEEARRLYVAHRLTMYCKVALPDGTTPTKAAIAAVGQLENQMSSKKVDDVQITYSSGSKSNMVNVDTGFADLSLTNYGLQLLSMLRLYHTTKYIS